MKVYAAITRIMPVSNLWNQFTDQIGEWLTDTEMWTDAAKVFLRIILIIMISRLVLMIVNKFIDHVTNTKRSKRLKLKTRRIQTVGRLLKNAASYTLNFIALLLILGEFHIQITPLLAGAGVVGLAIGFGAQSLVKDVITGFFIIIEDQFAVGDTIKTGEYKGVVEMIGLRATRIISPTGEVHIIPNGAINQVTNFSVNPIKAIIDIPLPMKDTTDELLDDVRTHLSRMKDSHMNEVPELLGIQSITMNQVTIRVTAQCNPMHIDEVTRMINSELKKAFEQKRVEGSA